MWLNTLPNGTDLHDIDLWMDGFTSTGRKGNTATETNVTRGVLIHGGRVMTYAGNGKSVITLPAAFNSIAATDFTIVFWVSFDDLTVDGTWVRLFEARFDANNFVQVAIHTNSKIQVKVEDATTQRGVVNDDNLSTSTEYHVAVTWDASANSIGFYVDAVLQSGVSSGNASPGDQKELHLGQRTDDSGSFEGDITQFIVFNKLLTATQIGQMYNKTK